jgi:NAD(P)H-dependent FMN reductase
MHNIAIISASVRTGRNSHRVALYLSNYITSTQVGNAEMLDLYEYQFPLFSERLRNLTNPPAGATAFAEKIKNADGVIIVTPEYNGGYPAALKNVIDLLYPEWKRKPIGIAAVSSGAFGGTQVVTSLTFTLLKIGALLSPALFQVATVQKSYDENGVPTDKETTNKFAKVFLDELFWCVEASNRMRDK